MNRKFLRKLKALTLSLAITSVFSTQIFANSVSTNTIQQTESKVAAYTKQDILELEPYIYTEDGLLRIDSESAIKDGKPVDLVEGQEEYFNLLNLDAEQGIITINEDLSIDGTASIHEDEREPLASHWSSCGGGKNTSTTEYWWGYARYACDCETNRMSADFNSCASVAAGVGVVGAYFGPIGAIPGGLSSAYWWLLASRLDANNHGKGVYIEMTWVLAFDITPQ